MLCTSCWPALALVGVSMLARPAAYTTTMARVWSPWLASGAFPLVAGVIVLLLAAPLCHFGYAATRRMGEHYE